MSGDSPVLRRTAQVTAEDDWYIARCVEPPVASQGRTQEEALVNLCEALALYFEDESGGRADRRVLLDLT